MIRIENVSFTYENVDNGAAILDNSIQISKGEKGKSSCCVGNQAVGKPRSVDW